MAIATLKIEDIDLDSGEVQLTCLVEGSKTDDNFMTAAEVMLRFIHTEINTPEFRNRLWAETAKLTADKDGVTIANDDQSPLSVAG